MGAALAFYTIFAIAPLFVIVLWIAGIWFGQEAARRELFSQVSGLVGTDGGKAIQSLLSAAQKPRNGAWATVIALTTLCAGATSVFVRLQTSLNSVWHVRPVPGRGMRNFIRNRLLSFAFVAGVGFLLLVSLILSAALSGLGKFSFGSPPAQERLWQGINFTVSFGVITLLFAVLFKVLPDAKIAWSDVWIGATVTALLFTAAGSLVVVLLWVYYSAQILLFGAQFTQIYSNRYGSHLQPAPGAELVPSQKTASRPRRRPERKAVESLEPAHPL